MANRASTPHILHAKASALPAALTYLRGPTTKAEQQKEALVLDIKELAERMKRPKPTSLKLRNGVDVELSDGMLSRLAGGDHLLESDWCALGGLIIAKQDPDFDMSPDGAKPNPFTDSRSLPAGKVRFSMQETYTSGVRNSRCWTIQLFTGANTEVKMYSVRQTYGDTHGAIHRPNWTGTHDRFKLSVRVHQVNLRFERFHY
jgi:hypothetical protein